VASIQFSSKFRSIGPPALRDTLAAALAERLPRGDTLTAIAW
jgi:hypothetical protein